MAEWSCMDMNGGVVSPTNFIGKRIENKRHMSSQYWRKYLENVFGKTKGWSKSQMSSQCCRQNVDGGIFFENRKVWSKSHKSSNIGTGGQGTLPIIHSAEHSPHWQQYRHHHCCHHHCHHHHRWHPSKTKSKVLISSLYHILLKRHCQYCDDSGPYSSTAELWYWVQLSELLDYVGAAWGVVVEYRFSMKVELCVGKEENSLNNSHSRENFWHSMQNVILIKLAIPVRKSSFHQSHKQWHLDQTELTQLVSSRWGKLSRLMFMEVFVFWAD